MESEAEHLAHLTFHLADAADRTRVVRALREDLDSRHEYFFHLGCNIDRCDSNKLQVFGAVNALRSLKEFVSESHRHVICSLLESHIGAELIHPAEECHAHQLVDLVLPREVVLPEPAIELFLQHLEVELLVELHLLVLELGLSQWLGSHCNDRLLVLEKSLASASDGLSHCSLVFLGRLKAHISQLTDVLRQMILLHLLLGRGTR